jgi:uncharacterized repeat protein (TIGR01451 family)
MFPSYRFRYLLPIALLLGSQSWLWLRPVRAASPTPGTIIENQATGSYVDDADNSTKNIESDKVTLTVAEVAGITISDPAISEPSAATIGANAASYQGIAGVNENDILYFDFVITNAGNDPTQFFIPGAPFQVSNGNFDRAQYGSVQIIEVKDGTGAVVPLPGGVTKIDIPAVGANTGDVGILGIPGGAITVGGSVKVRIPIKVTGTSGVVKVTLGDTGTNDNGAGTSNQTYTASSTTGADVKTTDNSNNTSLNNPISGEADGTPVGGEKEASRYGATNIVASPQIQGFKSAKLTDSNSDGKINPGETVTWTISYANTGTADVTNFQITDVLPTGVTKSGAIAIMGGNGQTSPTANPSYTGTNTTPGTTDTLLNAPITFKAGGTIVVTIPVTIDTGVTGTLTNQATAKADNLPLVGISTDNAGATTDLPSTVTNAPYSLTIPASSVSQTIGGTVDPTTINVTAIASNPNLLLVKRITSVNGGTTTVNGDDLAVYRDESTNPYDDNTIDPTLPKPQYPHKDTDKWPTLSTFLLGGTNGGQIKPNDEIDYTIYFLSAGDSTANNVTFCDLVPEHQSFVPTAFNSYTAASGGLNGTDRGILVSTSGTSLAYTNLADGDTASYYPPGATLPPACKKSATDPIPVNTNGAVVVNLGAIPNATAAGSPNDSYGFVRFRVRAK